MKRIGVVILLFVSIHFATFAADADSLMCKDLLIKVLNKMKYSEGIIKDGVFVKYTTTLINNADDTKVFALDSASVIMKDDKSLFISGNKKVYRDSLCEVVILDDTKRIIIAAGKNVSYEKSVLANYASLNDSIIRKSAVKHSELQMQKADSVLFVELELTKGVQEAFKVRGISFTINKSKLFVKRIEVMFTEGFKYKKTILDVQQADYHFKKEPFKGTALHKVMAKNGQLLDEYKEYSLTDLRKANN